MEKTKKKILFIINPISGNGKGVSVESQVASHLNHQLFEPDFIFTEYAGHAYEIALKAVHSNYEIVVAVGGDGTFSEVAKGLVGTDIVVGLIPLGSGNGMAGHLKIPIHCIKAIELLNAFKVKTIDTGLVNKTPFMGVFGLGFDALVADKFAIAKKRGFFSYIKIVATEFGKYEPITYNITIDDNTINVKAFIVCVANSSQYGNKATISPQSDISDGLFNLIVIEKMPFWALPKFLFYLFNSSLSSSKYFTEYVGQNIEILQNNSIAHFDGEPIEIEKKITVSINKSSLKVLC